MRRIAIAASLAGVLILGVPAAVLASGHHHHGRAHAGNHRRHHHHSRLMHISGTPASPEAAATVEKFEGGLLTLKLTNGSTIQGKVTSDTEIRCETSEPFARTSEDGGGWQGGGSWGGGSDQQGSDEQGSGSSSDEDHHSRSGSDEDDDDNGESTEKTEKTEMTEKPVCGEAALVPGAKVSSAELRIDASGATFKEITLIG
jgi:hypothetical protein